MPVLEVQGATLPTYAAQLNLLLQQCVAAGASIGFIAPLSDDKAAAFWANVHQSVQSGERRMALALDDDGQVQGTVQLVLDMPQNGQHRAEIAKLMVAPDARRRGIARSLMLWAEDVCRAEQRSLIVLDTRTGDAAEPLYFSLGFQLAGTIPGYAMSDTGTLDSTSIMYKQLLRG
ncbi:GNAT family N-acetyltransferase [Undibacterium aquatile]|uniref:GNAT family N-acetyltransferase n=1 Tax=Undibacterium aquatile TaxID=1537398 RepID=A0ABR6XC41_9BURK|nr:GNAT family N-acetyltransferase [Undibacterium aquatile]MBC3810390.1 GNAT family N-acetyltransferase [Undibacterium aquatile]